MKNIFLLLAVLPVLFFNCYTFSAELYEDATSEELQDKYEKAKIETVSEYELDDFIKTCKEQVILNYDLDKNDKERLLKQLDNLVFVEGLYLFFIVVSDEKPIDDINFNFHIYDKQKNDIPFATLFLIQKVNSYYGPMRMDTDFKYTWLIILDKPVREDYFSADQLPIFVNTYFPNQEYKIFTVGYNQQ